MSFPQTPKQKGSPMFCSQCGNRVEADSSFCPNCGTRITIDVAKTRSLPDKRPRSLPMLFKVLGVVLALISGAIVIGKLASTNVTGPLQSSKSYTKEELHRLLSAADTREGVNLSFRRAKQCSKSRVGHGGTMDL